MTNMHRSIEGRLKVQRIASGSLENKYLYKKLTFKGDNYNRLNIKMLNLIN